MPDRKDLDSFIGSTFRSVWALECLKYLAENPATYHSPDELIAALRASEAVVSQCIHNLTAAGVAVVDREGRVAYHELAGEDPTLVKEAIELYARSPDKVRRLIVAQSAPGATAFADAFRLRKD
ncbi:MAG TPA: helix-turn-helix domain-containing protein [Croceibacterium sp.]|nr:helix-turn-helix domain-containing protein [Croceibacterium sp.]